MMYAPHSPEARPSARSGGFTLTELLVVIVILVLVTAIAVPAFRSILYSSEATLAETRLAAALKAARDAALQSAPGSDTAAVFFYEPGGRTRVVVCVRVGEMADQGPAMGSGPNQSFYPQMREIFVPVTTIEPFELPTGWMIRGYVPPGWIYAEGHWYNRNEAGDIRYGQRSAEPYWVFPETGFYDRTAPYDGNDRQTFMIRFQGGAGNVVSSNANECLIVAPRRSAAGRLADDWQRIDLAQDYRRFVQRILHPQGIQLTGNPNRQHQILGNISSDTVLARPLSMIALYDERQMAAALGARIDRVTGCLYVEARTPQFVTVPSVPSHELGRRMRQWVEGDTNFDDVVNRASGDVPQAKIYTINRLTADLRPVEIDE